MIATYRSGAINAIYDKWFLKPIPPKGINLARRCRRPKTDA
jgi:glutamate/aspartate transport system substrate-binding protein